MTETAQSLSQLFTIYNDLIPLAPDIFKLAEQICLELFNSPRKENDEGDREDTIESYIDLQASLI